MCDFGIGIAIAGSDKSKSFVWDKVSHLRLQYVPNPQSTETIKNELQFIVMELCGFKKKQLNRLMVSLSYGVWWPWAPSTNVEIHHFMESTEVSADYCHYKSCKFMEKRTATKTMAMANGKFWFMNTFVCPIILIHTHVIEGENSFSAPTNHDQPQHRAQASVNLIAWPMNEKYCFVIPIVRECVCAGVCVVK